jgi:hypothetical protein
MDVQDVALTLGGKLRVALFIAWKDAAISSA